MKLCNIVTGIIRDAKTGQIKRTFTAKNDVTNYQLNLMASSLGSGNTNVIGPNIFISSANDWPFDQTNGAYSDIRDTLAIGYVESGVTSPRRYLGAGGSPPEYPYSEYQQRFDPPTADRNINVVGLTGATSISYGYVKADAWVALTTTCTQTTTETLDVFYRVQWVYDYDTRDYNNINNTALEAYTYTGIGRDFSYRSMLRFTGSGYNDYVNKYRISPLVYKNPKQITQNYTPATYSFSDNQLNENQYLTYNTTIGKTNIDTSGNISEGLGKVIGVLEYGTGSTAGSTAVTIAARKILDENASPIQNIFGHSSTATKPFYDSTQLNTGTGTISLNGNSWTNPDFPKMYKIEITATGEVGTATYKFSVRDHLGFVDNTYTDVVAHLNAMSHYNSESRFDGFKLGDAAIDYWTPHIIPIDKKTIIAVSEQQVAVIDLLKQYSINTFSSKNYSNFVPTNITQAIRDPNGTIWVACRDTGLYKIENPLTTSPTVSKIDVTANLPEKSYGVTYTQAGGSPLTYRVWTFIEDNSANGDLYYSDDNGTTWTAAGYTNTNISPVYNRIKFIIGDPVHADDRLGIFYDQDTSTTTTYIKISWWDFVNQTPVDTSTYINSLTKGSEYRYGYFSFNGDRPLSYLRQFNVQPTQGRWVYINIGTSSRVYIINYGSTSYNAVGTTYYSVFPVMFDENENVILTDNQSTGIGIIKTDMTGAETLILSTPDGSGNATNAFTSGMLAYLGNATWLGCYTSTAFYTQYYLSILAERNTVDGGALKPQIWREYGWNGTAWELNNPNSKTIHSTLEELEDGIFIGFNNGTSTPSFVATDYYTFGVVDGIWMDGATDFTHKVSLYWYPSEVQSGLSLGSTGNSTTTLPTVIEPVNYFNNILHVNTDFQDITNLSYSSAYNTLYLNSSTAVGGARSIHPIGTGDNVVDITALQGYYYFSFHANGQALDVGRKITFGISDSSVLGTAVSGNIQYGVSLVGNPDGTNVSIYSHANGTETLVGSRNFEPFVGSSTTNYLYVKLYKDGSLRLERFEQYSGYMLLHEFPAGTVPNPTTTDYHFDFACSGDASASYNGIGVKNLNARVLVPKDYYIHLGDLASNTGRWTNNFKAVDYETRFDVKVAIGSPPTLTPVTQIGINDTTTALNSGEVSVFPTAGAIRFSPSDAGMQITATFTVTKQK